MATNVCCSVCIEIFDNAFSYLCQSNESPVRAIRQEEKVIPLLFISVARWESSASCCHLCAILYDTVNQERIERIHAIDLPDAGLCMVTAVRGESIEFTLSHRSYHSSDKGTLNVEFVLQPFNDEPNHLPAASPATFSLAIAKQLKCWLLECTNSHPSCYPQSKTHLLPLILIDVDPKSCISNLEDRDGDLSQFSLDATPQVVICSTSELLETTQYLTLSHRWDSSPSILLSNSTLPVFSKGIPLSLLDEPNSKTFKNAMVVTKSLGFQYLWIDTLCINQDDKIEKSIEINFMGEIYRNSSANISATGAAKGADGLFFERNPLTTDPCRKRFATPNGLKPFVDVVASLSRRWEKYVDIAPINTRGWVYQERMLAPRVLHFAQDQGTYWMWKWTVEKYTSLFLSYSRDSLLAISAIAQHYCMRLDLTAEDYLAGCWHGGLPCILDWVCNEYRPNSRIYIAPSWSWASVGGPIYYRGRGFERYSSLVEIIEALIVPKGGDLFGEITSGHLRATCSLCQALWQPGAERLNIVTKTCGKLQVADSRHIGLSWDDQAFHTQGFQMDSFWMSMPHDRLYFSDNEFYLMPLQRKEDSNEPLYAIDGLILYRTPRRGQYVRVGRFSCLYGEILVEIGDNDDVFENHSGSGRDMTVEEIYEALLGQLQVLDPDNSLEDIVDGKCVIEII